MKSPATRKKRWIVRILLAVVLAGAAYYGGRHYVWPAIKNWRIARMNREARGFLASGDLTNALLVARKSLQASAQNADAWRIAASASSARQKPDAVWYQDSLCRVEPTKENYMELMRLALRFDVPDFAVNAIKSIEKEAQGDAEFHRLAANAYKRVGRRAAAEVQLVQLIHLQPGDLTAQLDLAEIELANDSRHRDTALRAQVLALAAHTELRVRALTMLLRDNIAGKVTAGTADLVRQLQLTAGLDVSSRLLAIQALYMLADPSAPEMLAQLQVDSADKPLDVARVLEFYLRTGQPEKVQPWVATLPDATRKDQTVQWMVAEALLKLHDEAGLDAYLTGKTWPGHEYLRQAFIAHADRALGRSADFAAAWKLALIDAGSDLRKSTALLNRVDEWRWVNERHDVVWKLFALTPTNESVQKILILWERHQGNTTNLNRLFKRVVEVQPGDPVAANNLAYTDLLLNSDIAQAGLLARRLVALAPKNPFFNTTYALALYKQGHPADALARFDAMTAAERGDPVRSLIYAVCLTAVGKGSQASDILDGVVLSGMLPEERQLADNARADIALLDRAQGNRSRLLAIRQKQEPDAIASGWLAVLPVDFRKTATTDMQLADSLYATPDLDGLQELLRTTDWKDGNYLRSALQSYVSRQHNDLARSTEQWQQAIALANVNRGRLQNLNLLATKWQWPIEKVTTQNLIFERDPTNHELLTELLRYYRDARRTSDLQRLLGLYVGNSTDPSDEAVAQAYYSFLLDVDVAHAHVIARNAFVLAPAEPVRRMVYAFSLWKQQRAAEAVPLVNEMRADAKSEVISIPLVKALIQAQVGAFEAAEASLAQFKEDSALPEESALAAKISAQLAAHREAVKPPQT